MKKFGRYEQLKDYGVFWSRAHVDREQKAGRFPQKMWLGPNTVAYLESEIVAWVEARCAERAEVAADRAVKFSQRPKPKPRKFKTSNKTEDKQAEAAQ